MGHLDRLSGWKDICFHKNDPNDFVILLFCWHYILMTQRAITKWTIEIFRPRKRHNEDPDALLHSISHKPSYFFVFYICVFSICLLCVSSLWVIGFLSLVNRWDVYIANCMQICDSYCTIEWIVDLFICMSAQTQHIFCVINVRLILEPCSFSSMFLLFNSIVFSSNAFNVFFSTQCDAIIWDFDDRLYWIFFSKKTIYGYIKYKKLK